MVCSDAVLKFWEVWDMSWGGGRWKQPNALSLLPPRFRTSQSRHGNRCSVRRVHLKVALSFPRKLLLGETDNLFLPAPFSSCSSGTWRHLFLCELIRVLAKRLVHAGSGSPKILKVAAPARGKALSQICTRRDWQTSKRTLWAALRRF